jgi:hypothetical protein
MECPAHLNPINKELNKYLNVSLPKMDETRANKQNAIIIARLTMINRHSTGSCTEY